MVFANVNGNTFDSAYDVFHTSSFKGINFMDKTCLLVLNSDKSGKVSSGLLDVFNESNYQLTISTFNKINALTHRSKEKCRDSELDFVLPFANDDG
ncbi:hypothetical protein L596_004715 [Steinernema carpocapsae]|uniref:Uncharacterized protein n=1 Tax=Steinernema carpocapsae TaxID=34508 RepID=A0A4U8UY64_STECR|nr:hypothetical protein L596_004715 [Steinernema carpocapsae]